MAALAAGNGRVAQLTQHYDRVLTDLAEERDALQAERAAILQVRPPAPPLRGFRTSKLSPHPVMIIIDLILNLGRPC